MSNHSNNCKVITFGTFDLFHFGHLLATQIILSSLTQAQTIRQHQNGQGFLPHQIRQFILPLISMRLKTRNSFSKHIIKPSFIMTEFYLGFHLPTIMGMKVRYSLPTHH